jgi:uncharacterized protein
MPGKNRERAGADTPARSDLESRAHPVEETAGAADQESEKLREGKETMPPYEPQVAKHAGTAPEGISVIGEAVRRVAPESAEFLIEITTGAPNAAQALRENHAKTAQLGQAVTPLGVQHTDVQSISLNLYNMYAPPLQALPPFGMPPQIGQPGFHPPAGAANLLSELQFGIYHARNTLRVTVRDPNRLGEIAELVTRAGAVILGEFCFRGSDEAQARKAALEAAGKDARAKAEALAASTGKHVGDAVAISEDLIATNGVYAALRTTAPWAFGAGAPQVIGELEYYARVSANFRFA